MEGFSIIGAKGFRQDESALQGGMERKNMRLDKYLKVSRIIKRRTVANEACDSGRVMLNDKVARASAEVKVGDAIEIAFGNKSVKVRVTSVQETIRKEDAKEMFEYLKGYSPLHNLKPGTKHPATLVTTADHDDRVVPAHSFKFAATLQADNDGTNPTLIRIDSKAGHGAGKPMAKVLEEQADIYGFIMYNLGMKPKF